MTPRFTVIHDDLINVPSDMLLLKHAGGFYGADGNISNLLIERGICRVSDLVLGPGSHVVIKSQGVIKPIQTMFLGTVSLSEFDYSQMYRFAVQAMKLLAAEKLALNRLTTTIHGAGYGLDSEEALLSLVSGFMTDCRRVPSW